MPRPKGRPAKYGKKIKVAALLKQTAQLQQAPSPVYGEKGVILRSRAADLLWRPVGILVRFVGVLHPAGEHGPHGPRKGPHLHRQRRAGWRYRVVAAVPAGGLRDQRCWAVGGSPERDRPGLQQ
jgi:hypothetical protein